MLCRSINACFYTWYAICSTFPNWQSQSFDHLFTHQFHPKCSISWNISIKIVNAWSPNDLPHFKKNKIDERIKSIQTNLESNMSPVTISLFNWACDAHNKGITYEILDRDWKTNKKLMYIQYHIYNNVDYILINQLTNKFSPP